jgi:antitoxin component YwqK of YwqJK toxin-antitoxin module
MALVSADTSAEIKNITLDSFVKRHFAKPPARYKQFSKVSNMKLRFFIVTLIFAPFLSLLGQEEGWLKITVRNDKGKVMESRGVLLLPDGRMINDSAHIRYYPNGKMQDSAFYERGVIVGNAYTFDKRGRITSVTEFSRMAFPRRVKVTSFHYSGRTRKIEGEYIEQANGEDIKIGTWKYYRKNGQVGDMVTYENGVRIYRATFNKKGELNHEWKY